MMKPIHSRLLFLTILLLVSLFYGYHQLVFKKPQSIHQWRQADCASIALNYYQNGMHFFSPEVHNLTSDGGTSGQCMTSEIPLLYYASATLYQFFGYHDYLYRILNTLLFLLGLFYLFKSFFLLTKNYFWSIALTLFIFSSPVLVFYGNNYLSNSTAFAFSLIGWYFLLRFLDEHKRRSFYTSMLIFFLAASLKVTALFSVFALVGVFIFELVKLKKPVDLLKPTLKKWQFMLPVALIVLAIGSWLIYAGKFNKLHDCTYFSTTIFPIWNYDIDSIKTILEQIYKNWGTQYFHASAFLLLLICLIYLFTRTRKTNSFFRYVIVFLLLEGLAYFLLQFWTFRDHDYYTIDLYIVPVIILLAAIQALQKNQPKFFNALWVKVVFAIFVGFNLFYARTQLQDRYSEKHNDYAKFEDRYSVTPYLRSIGISANDTVFSIPDASHVSLYLMNQKGWTEYTDQRFNRGTAYHYNSDSTTIEQSISRGAKYLIIYGIEELYKKPYLQPFCNFLVGKYNNILVFELNNPKTNFNLGDRKIKKHLFCDAERLSEDSLNFTNDAGELFANAETRSAEVACHGNYSARLDATHPYGMTLKLTDMEAGESFLISVWQKKSGKKDGVLITSATDYYNSYSSTIATDSLGWEKLQKEIFITKELEGKELAIYLYNPEKEPVWFDDFSVTWFEKYQTEQILPEN